MRLLRNFVQHYYLLLCCRYLLRDRSNLLLTILYHRSMHRYISFTSKFDIDLLLIPHKHNFILLFLLYCIECNRNGREAVRRDLLVASKHTSPTINLHQDSLSLITRRPFMQLVLDIFRLRFRSNNNIDHTCEHLSSITVP